MICRSFCFDDYPAVISLWQAAGLEVGPSDTHEAIHTQLARDPDLFLVAEKQGAVVGTVYGRFDGRRGWVNRLAVRPDEQRNGIGRELLAELEWRLTALGCTKINLLIEVDNASVESFYQRQGYTTDPLVFMEKRL
jgi:ribosomal protein S18 acetylase RimI-like enzyme